MSPDDMGLGLKSCVVGYLLELGILLPMYKWGFFRRGWFWIMEQMTKRNGKGILLREIEKVLKRFVTSLEFLLERVKT